MSTAASTTMIPVTPTTTTKAPTSSSSDKIIGILADLLIKTINLSFTIKGALDRNSGGEENVQFGIVSRNDDVDDETIYIENTPDDFIDIPDLIKITPEDAMFIHDEKEAIESTTRESIEKSIIIELDREDFGHFNVTNGMILEIDLSNLPSQQPQRNEEIRLRVKNFINSLELMNEGEVGSDKIESEDGSSLSDAIIKNITQIVLLQMNEASQHQNISFLFPGLSKISTTTWIPETISQSQSEPEDAASAVTETSEITQRTSTISSPQLSTTLGKNIIIK